MQLVHAVNDSDVQVWMLIRPHGECRVFSKFNDLLCRQVETPGGRGNAVPGCIYLLTRKLAVNGRVVKE